MLEKSKISGRKLSSMRGKSDTKSTQATFPTWTNQIQFSLIQLESNSIRNCWKNGVETETIESRIGDQKVASKWRHDVFISRQINPAPAAARWHCLLPLIQLSQVNSS